MSKPSHVNFENGNSTKGAIPMPSGAAHCIVSHGTLGHAITSVVTKMTANSISETTRLNSIDPMK